MGWCFFQDHKCIDNIDNLLHSGFTHLSAASSRYLLVTGLSRKTEGLMSRVLKWNCMGCGIQIRKHTEVRSRRWFLGRGLVSSYHSNHVGQGPKHFIIFFLFPFSPPSFVCEIEPVSVCNLGWPSRLLSSWLSLLAAGNTPSCWVSLCSSGWTGTHSVAEADLRLVAALPQLPGVGVIGTTDDRYIVV